jgi:Kef-type K+ transport system membrane component KefB
MTHLFVLAVLVLLQGILLKGFPHAFSLVEVQLTLNFGFLLLAAYLFGEWTVRIRLPKLTGYIFAGLLLGPDVMGYFSRESVEALLFIDELALTFIALSAGLELDMEDLRKQWRLLTGLTLAIPVSVFTLVVPFVYFALPQLGLLPALPPAQRAVLAALLGTLAIARSPSSTLAVIKECRARGSFSESALCVTVVTDIFVIVFFSFFLSLGWAADPRGPSFEMGLLMTILAGISLCLVLGFLLAWFMSIYVRYIRTESIFFLLCVAFVVTRFSLAFPEQSARLAGVSLHLDPLLICMSAGFFLRNRFRRGAFYERAIERSFLPIFVVFFALAGTRLDLEAFGSVWRWALLFVAIRMLGIFLGSHGVLWRLHAPFRMGSFYGMSFITQAGVSIGLASMIPRRFPVGGEGLYTLVLAVIVINQIVGPIAFKFALEQSGEAKTARSRLSERSVPAPGGGRFE